jgi:hypothetical protein
MSKVADEYIRLENIGVAPYYPYNLPQAMLAALCIFMNGVLIAVCGYDHAGAAVIGVAIGCLIVLPVEWKVLRSAVSKDFVNLVARLRVEPRLSKFKFSEQQYILLAFDFYSKEHPRVRFTICGEEVVYSAKE